MRTRTRRPITELAVHEVRRHVEAYADRIVRHAEQAAIEEDRLRHVQGLRHTCKLEAHHVEQGRIWGSRQ